MTPHECILACFAIASSGHLEEAKTNLLRNRPCLEKEEGIDLLARIELRLGNETEARRLWTQAVDSGVGGRRSRRALDALDSVAWRHRRLIRNLRRGFAIGIPALLGLLVGLLIGCPSAPSSQTETIQPELQRQQEATVEVETMVAAISTLESEPESKPNIGAETESEFPQTTDLESERESACESALTCEPDTAIAPNAAEEL